MNTKYPNEELAGGGVEICYPTMDFFINKIENNEYFIFMKWNHGVWDLIIRCIRYQSLSTYTTPEGLQWKGEGKPLLLPDKISDSFLSKISDGALIDPAAKEWNLEPWLFFECLKIMTGPKSENVLSGVSCRIRSSSNQEDIIKKFTENENKPLIHGDIWKSYVLEDKEKNVSERQFRKFVNSYKDRILFIGPNDFASNMPQLCISMKAASKPDSIKTIYEKIKEFYKPGVIYIFSAGLLSTYLIDKIHQELQESFAIDIGLASNLYKYQMLSPEKFLNDMKIHSSCPMNRIGILSTEKLTSCRFCDERRFCRSSPCYSQDEILKRFVREFERLPTNEELSADGLFT